jgi:hypothetical protein
MDEYSAIAPKELKQRKASGNGEYNLIKYVRCHHHTWYEATTCPAQILASNNHAGGLDYNILYNIPTWLGNYI